MLRLLCSGLGRELFDSGQWFSSRSVSGAPGPPAKGGVPKSRQAFCITLGAKTRCPQETILKAKNLKCGLLAFFTPCSGDTDSCEVLDFYCALLYFHINPSSFGGLGI